MDDVTARRLGNALLYWMEHSPRHDLTNLYKFIYFVDFAKAKLTGRPVFSFTYVADQFGPVPQEVRKELEERYAASPLSEFVLFRRYQDEGSRTRYQIDPKGSSDIAAVFSRKEQDILGKVAFIMKELTATQATAATHVAGDPWARVYNSKGRFAPIDMMLAFEMDGFGEPDDPEEAKEKLSFLLHQKAA